jgi:hypothetical protein
LKNLFTILPLPGGNGVIQLAVKLVMPLLATRICSEDK